MTGCPYLAVVVARKEAEDLARWQGQGREDRWREGLLRIAAEEDARRPWLRPAKAAEKVVVKPVAPAPQPRLLEEAAGVGREQPKHWWQE